VRSRSIDAVWMCSAFCASLALAVSVLITLGTGERGIHAALAATARLAFLLFWPAYSGSALASLFGHAFRPLRQYAREFGLAFSSALLVHLGLVGLLCLIGATPPVSTFILFGIAVAWAYLLALFSIPRLHQALGPKYWWLLSNVGMNYLAYAFFVDFRNEPLQGGIKHVIEYFPFAVLAVAGPGLRLTAFVQRVGRKWRDSSFR
jgi:predicted neutral ceramidase superfamily lipid hydrolase